MIGSIVNKTCQSVLGKESNITIDFDTRLALTIIATEADWDNVMEALPKEVKDEWELLSTSVLDNGRLKVEMRPKPPERLVFTPLNPVEGVEPRLNRVEKFLKEAYPE